MYKLMCMSSILIFGDENFPEKNKSVQFLDYRVGGNDHGVHQAFPIQGVHLRVSSKWSCYNLIKWPKISR